MDSSVGTEMLRSWTLLSNLSLVSLLVSMALLAIKGRLTAPARIARKRHRRLPSE